MILNITHDKYGEDEYTGIHLKLITNKITETIHFSEGEPEDFTMCRDLNDAYKIQDFVKAAYEAGKNGEELIINEN